ncbi:PREDICTED: probable BOI-related E3 ubiquitin-protein ligase 3 [Tarenaya hassleriana]|uniref:probable BOI-related E3 ubiquitin-protein ligase 3 n=1 Tax=Tarenaya hassleriana TaxID=28532 RepID=UPI00053C84E1|nr:PREDICTED: probable BOI-related E3 ubiquitin-protein ligase 3 [Tarenaya hassleriana]
MAIQAQLNYDSRTANNIGFPLIGGGSEFTPMNNAGFGQSFVNLQSLKSMNQQALYHQQCQSQSFFAAHMEKQRQDIDHFIRSQNERLRFVLQDQRKQQTEMILRKMEAKASFLITQKDEEIARASNKKMELEALLRKMEMENLTWQRMARENEAMVETLNNTLEKIRERACYPAAAEAAEDEGSCCGGGESFPAVDCLDGEKMMSCRNCGSSNGETCVLILPCRHLCCCTKCEASLDLCPVCKTPKKATIEALIF